MKTFGKTFLEIDKMAGLRMNDGNGTILSVRNWDNPHTPEVQGALYSQDALIWEGTLWTRDEINRIFQPQETDGSPITYARRSGKLGVPKIAGVLRLASSNGTDFALQKCDGGEAVQGVLATIQGTKQIILKSSIGPGTLASILLDEQRDDAKLRRLKTLGG